MSNKGLKIAGLVTTIAGAGIGILSNILGEKKQDQVIEEKVSKAIQKALEKKEV